MSETTAIATTTQKGQRAVAKTHNIMDMILDEMGPLAFCEHLAASGLYAKGNNALAKIVAIIATGAEVGMPPMWSLKNIQFVGDKHSFTAGGVGDLVMRSGYMMYHITEKTPLRCELRWTRNGEDVGNSYFDVEKARTAGLWGSNTWKKYPESMLFARALTDGGRTYCPEVFGGSPYTPEELQRSEVVSVTQSGRMPGVEHPDITQRPDGRAQADYGKERVEARNRLVAIVKDCTTSREQQIRVWNACLMKADKNDKMMTAEDYSEAAGRVKAFSEDDNLTEWCDTIHGPDPDVVGDAEVVEPAEDPAEKDRKSANGLFHAVLGKFLEANKYVAKGAQYTIIKDVVRSQCDLEAGADWSGVTPVSMRQMAKTLEYDGGNLAKVGLAGDWATLAAERGAI